MTLAELLVKIASAILSVVTILIVLYYINKMALKKAEKASAEFDKQMTELKKKKSKNESKKG